MARGVSRAGSRPGRNLEEAADSFDRFSLGLVRLESFALAEVQGEVEAFARAVARHIEQAEGSGHVARSPGRANPAPLLALEHARFRASIQELRHLLTVVEREDHGGHRQALGQYGRIFVEALQRHLREERVAELAAEEGGRPRTPVPPGNRN